MLVEYGSEELDRLAHDSGFRAPQWSADVVIAYRRKNQLIRAAASKLDLEAMRSLRMTDLDGSRPGASAIRVNEKAQIIVHFRSEGVPTAVILELADHQ